MNLPASSSMGVNLCWIGGDKPNDEGFICFHVGGVEGEETVRWNTPDLSIGDEITIKLSEESVGESPSVRSPYTKMERS